MDIQESMKAALRRFPAAVNVIALRTGEGAFLAITATAVTVASLQPPTMLVCISRESVVGQALAGTETLSINVLGLAQQDVAAACAGARPQPERETVGCWRDVAGAPRLDGAQANFMCRKTGLITCGTHHLVLAEVLAADSAEQGQPLAYMDRAYGTFAPLPA